MHVYLGICLGSMNTCPFDIHMYIINTWGSSIEPFDRSWVIFKVPSRFPYLPRSTIPKVQMLLERP